jgi:DNA-directed RNA polymerase specialized sigma24 family protein
MGHPDAELMGRWRRGDAAAFGDLVDRWQQPVARFLLRVVGRADGVPDLCQEVFLRVLRAAPRYRETGRFPTLVVPDRVECCPRRRPARPACPRVAGRW